MAGDALLRSLILLGSITSEAHFYAIDGEHVARTKTTSPPSPFLQERRERVRCLISLKMRDVIVEEIIADHQFMNTGSPHYVSFVKDVEGMDIVSHAQKIRFSERFLEERDQRRFCRSQKDLFVRTYERGVEDETLSLRHRRHRLCPRRCREIPA